MTAIPGELFRGRSGCCARMELSDSCAGIDLATGVGSTPSSVSACGLVIVARCAAHAPHGIRVTAIPVAWAWPGPSAAHPETRARKPRVTAIPTRSTRSLSADPAEPHPSSSSRDRNSRGNSRRRRDTPTAKSLNSHRFPRGCVIRVTAIPVWAEARRRVRPVGPIATNRSGLQLA